MGAGSWVKALAFRPGMSLHASSYANKPPLFFDHGNALPRATNVTCVVFVCVSVCVCVCVLMRACCFVCLCACGEYLCMACVWVFV